MFTKETLKQIDTMPIYQKLYGKDKWAKRRWLSLLEAFSKHFGEPKEFYLFSTPGRTEICGNHTDHNHGCVLAASVNLDSAAVVVPVKENVITVVSAGYARPFQVNLSSLEKNDRESGTTVALIRGIAAKFAEKGYKIGGFQAYIQSDVKRGSGLSSSASIEVLIGTILHRLYNQSANITPLELAQIGQYAENKYFGKPCGLMDQTACAVGGVIAIDFLDTENPKVEKVSLDMEALGYCIAVVDTGGNHTDLTDEYAAVTSEMRAIANDFGMDALRGIEMNQILERAGQLRQKYGDRAVLRAIHFILDNERVKKQTRLIQEGNFDQFLEYVNESGDSSWEYLQNCMSVKNPSEQGITLGIAITRQFCKGKKIAVRVHGGGFAGTIQTFLPLEDFEEYRAEMESVFGAGCVTKLNIRDIGTLCIE